ncbi:uncharacterized protein GIQ15_00389 [Arthroderma uncinatum]|uniref:uncharacterized protein n=1 Tax=Arthroderma uncinatum TaxID=74035 RepID=UPI00144A7366|nr:uncharacterized protein GIQ15_00389 [Arthroderma uncinatum]KAF3490872.1 hypothetical protein GIQ15_00389 [Arthroderma uncinatum]
MSDIEDKPQMAKGKDTESDDEGEVFHDARFPPDVEAELLNQSHSQKAEANTLFSTSRYSEAITTYGRAISICPNYLDFEIAVLQSNIAACHLKLEDWKAAVDAATSSISCLDRLIPTSPPTLHSSSTERSSGGSGVDEQSSGAQVVELPDDADQEQEEDVLKRLNENDTRREDVMRIRGKSLMRRAKGRMALGGWSNLQGAEEDYKSLLQLKVLPPHDQRVVRTALQELPARINEAKDTEMAEMMGKLKDLGNGILKPFGLSTDNFKFVKDEKTGGYSMGFEK